MSDESASLTSGIGYCTKVRTSATGAGRSIYQAGRLRIHSSIRSTGAVGANANVFQSHVPAKPDRTEHYWAAQSGAPAEKASIARASALMRNTFGGGE
jgi:hypothetical protein